MTPAFHVCSFSIDGRFELSLEEKILLFCSADQWQQHYGPMDLICDEHFFNYIVREGLDELYMNIVPLPEGTDLVETALKTAPIGHVYLGIDVVVDEGLEVFRYANLFKAEGPNDLLRDGLAFYPKRSVKESIELLEVLPEWIEDFVENT
jgi:hypothetical protein